MIFLGKKLSEDELNSLIAHAHRRIEQLQKQLAEQIAMEQQVCEDDTFKIQKKHGILEKAEWNLRKLTEKKIL